MDLDPPKVSPGPKSNLIAEKKKIVFGHEYEVCSDLKLNLHSRKEKIVPETNLK